MSLSFNNVLSQMKPSASMQKGLTEGSTAHNLAVGSPDIQAPERIKELLQEYAQSPDLQYQPTKGSLQAIQNVIELIDSGNPNLQDGKNVILVPGAKYGVYLSLKTLCNPGDSVVLIEPYWLSYTDICISLGLQQSFWRPRENEYFVEDFIQLVENSKQKPKVLVINNPINPSGYIFNSEFISHLLDYCASSGIWLILDEVYKDLCFDHELNLHKHLYSDNLIRIGSFSKSLAIPGFRAGYIFASEQFISNFNLLHQHIATSINAQTNFILKNIPKTVYTEFTKFCSEKYQNRFEVAYRALISKQYQPLKSNASFYMLFDVTSKFENGESACEHYEKQGILMTPGIHYGTAYKHTVRICLTKESEVLEQIIKLL